MNEIAFTVIGFVLGALAAWNWRIYLDECRKRRQLEAWHKARKFFS